eukprot:351780-Chlamydomonas_euryale.AAC.4
MSAQSYLWRSHIKNEYLSQEGQAFQKNVTLGKIRLACICCFRALAFSAPASVYNCRQKSLSLPVGLNLCSTQTTDAAGRPAYAAAHPRRAAARSRGMEKRRGNE